MDMLHVNNLVKELPMKVSYNRNIHSLTCMCVYISGPIVYSHSEYGDGEYPIVMSNVGCEGWEKSITDCSHHSYESTSCSRANLAGVLCHDG